MTSLTNTAEVRANINGIARTSPVSQAIGLRIHEPNGRPARASAAAPERTATSEAAAKATNAQRRRLLLDVVLLSVNGAPFY